jgi:hypothetical protein
MTMYEQDNFDRLQHFPNCECKNCIDHESHARNGIHVFPDRLYIVTTIFNPLRFRSKYWNYNLFENMIEKSGAILYTAEIAWGDRHFEVTQPYNPRHLQLRAKDNQEIWLKENSLNLLINRLPTDAKYIAVVDADVGFARPDFAQETLHLLQHYSWIQMFSHATDLGVNYEPLHTIPGFVYGKKEIIEESEPNVSRTEGYYYGLVKKTSGEKKSRWLYRHPGYAHAFRKEAYDKVGGLVDWTILGSGDYVMSKSLFGEVEDTIRGDYTENYKKLCREWEYRALRHIRKNVGYLPGTIYHYFHGDKIARNYNTRWKLLVDAKFDPLTDLKKDWQGLYTLEDHGDDRSIDLRDGIRRYARIRNEDTNVGIIVP